MSGKEPGETLAKKGQDMCFSDKIKKLSSNHFMEGM